MHYNLVYFTEVVKKIFVGLMAYSITPCNIVCFYGKEVYIMKKALCTAVLASSLLLGAGDVLAMEHDIREETSQNSTSLPTQDLGTTGSVDFTQPLLPLVRCHGSEFLHSAATKGRLNVVKHLVEECHCDASEKDKDGETALQGASHYGHLDIVKYLVEECHCDASEKDVAGRAALHLASIRGHLNIVKYLVEECHCDASEKDDDGRTALSYACYHGHLDIVKYLVEECHCDVNAKDIHGDTALEAAGEYPRLVEYIRSVQGI